MGLIHFELKEWDKALNYLGQVFKLNKFCSSEILNLQAKTY
jgi:hypothetical protein